MSDQLVVAKFLKESCEKLEKQIDVTNYYTKRADAVDKLVLSKSTVSKTTTNTSINSTGGKDGDEKKTNQTVVEMIDSSSIRKSSTSKISFVITASHRSQNKHLK